MKRFRKRVRPFAPFTQYYDYPTVPSDEYTLFAPLIYLIIFTFYVFIIYPAYKMHSHWPTIRTIYIFIHHNIHTFLQDLTNCVMVQANSLQQLSDNFVNIYAIGLLVIVSEISIQQQPFIAKQIETTLCGMWYGTYHCQLPRICRTLNNTNNLEKVLDTLFKVC